MPDNFVIPIRELRAEHIGKLILVSGMIRKATEVRPELMVAAFQCQRCAETTRVVQEEGKYTEPFECGNDVCSRKGPFKLLQAESNFTDVEKLRIQEDASDLRGGQMQQTLDAKVYGDLTGQISPGDHVKVTGILRSYQRSTQHGKATVFDLVLDVNSFEIREKGFDEIEITKEDVEKIKELSKDADIYNKIIKSIAPTIYGYDDVKESLALQQFGGLAKELPDGTKLRGDIHMLLVGDPGVAKSQLLRYQKTLAPRGIYTSGKSSTSAGLTATAVKDDFGEGRWTLEAGALVLADMGLACVDELDKMEDEDRSSMHEAMEQQTITVAKAGMLTTLKSRCALLGAANPKYGRFDRYEPIAKQINMAPTLLSRFDLIFILMDEPLSSRDAAISSHIFRTHRAGEMKLKKQKVTNSGITDEQVNEAMKTIQPEISSDLLRKYISYSRMNVFPIFDQEAESTLINYYLNLRKMGEQPETPLPVTARQLEALIRLGEASARVRLSSIVTQEDARRVIKIVMSSLRQVATDPDTGKLDADIINTGIGRSQRDRIKIVRNMIRERNGSGPISKSEIEEQSGMKKEDLDDIISKLKIMGEILEVSENRFVSG
jgi:replicative DNA helicase Mcm